MIQNNKNTTKNYFLPRVHPSQAQKSLYYYAVNQRWSPRGRHWPQGHILKSLALASKVKSLALKPQVLENCHVFGSRTALFFVPLKSCWKTPETSRKICKDLFCFPQLEQSCKSGRAFWVEFGPKVDRNFGLDLGRRRTFCRMCTKI